MIKNVIPFNIKEPSDGNGFVYLICEYDNIQVDNTHCKIGVTTGNLDARLKKLQTGNISRLHCLSYYESSDPFKLEKMLHNHYHNKRVKGGEWFILTDDDILSFKNICDNKQKIINILKESNPFFQ
jgi:hypothetical protein